jgi:hypothetical protein
MFNSQRSLKTYLINFVPDSCDGKSDKSLVNKEISTLVSPSGDKELVGFAKL